MIFIVSLAFVAIIASLGLAMYYMLKGGKSDATNATEGHNPSEPSNATQLAKSRNMSKALALQFGLVHHAFPVHIDQLATRMDRTHRHQAGQ
jgi:flagellar basal body-associated protein FliL